MDKYLKSKFLLSGADRLRFLEIVAANNPDFVFVKNARFEIVYANDRFLALYPESTRDSVLGSTTVESYSAAEADAFLKDDRHAMEHGTCETEERIRFPDGSRRVLFTKKVRFTNDIGELFVLGVSRDITDLKTTQERLEELTERFELAFTGAAAGLWDWDIQGDKYVFSARALAILGVSDDDPNPPTTGPEFVQQVHPEDRDMIHAAIDRHLTQREPYDIEYRVQLTDGSVRWVHARGQALWDKQGNARRMAGSLDDITLRRLAGDRLLAANVELERFAYVASHDLQEPLRMIISFSTLLEERLKSVIDEETKEYLDIIRDSGERMRLLILDLLTYARLKEQDSRAPLCDLNVALGAALDNLKQRIEDSNAEIIYGTLPCVALSGDRALSLFQNLIANALKYAHPDRAPVIELKVQHHGNNWHLCMSDNGIGIRAEYCEQIFEPFKRLGRQVPGTGMGLAICRRSVESVGGSISVHSKPGEGSEFCIRLPEAAVSYTNLPESA